MEYAVISRHVGNFHYDNWILYVPFTSCSLGTETTNTVPRANVIVLWVSVDFIGFEVHLTGATKIPKLSTWLFNSDHATKTSPKMHYQMHATVHIHAPGGSVKVTLRHDLVAQVALMLACNINDTKNITTNYSIIIIHAWMAASQTLFTWFGPPFSSKTRFQSCGHTSLSPSENG